MNSKWHQRIIYPLWISYLYSRPCMVIVNNSVIPPKWIYHQRIDIHGMTLDWIVHLDSHGVSAIYVSRCEVLFTVLFCLSWDLRSTFNCNSPCIQHLILAWCWACAGQHQPSMKPTSNVCRVNTALGPLSTWQGLLLPVGCIIAKRASSLSLFFFCGDWQCILWELGIIPAGVTHRTQHCNHLVSIDCTLVYGYS